MQPTIPQPATAPNQFREGELEDTGNDPELLGDFVVEAREHLSHIEMRLLSLDHEPNHAGSLNAIFRSFYTIKGLAGFLNLSALAAVAQEMETMLDQVRTGKMTISSEQVAVILSSTGFLARRIDELNSFLRTGRKPGSAGHQQLLNATGTRVTDPIQN